MPAENQENTKPHCSETFLKLLTDIPTPAIFVWQWLQVVGIFENEDENMDVFKKIAIPLTVLALFSFIFSEYQSRTNTIFCQPITKPIEKINQGIIYTTAIPVIAHHALSQSLDIDPSYFLETSIYFSMFYLFLAGAHLELNQTLSYKQEFQIIKSRFYSLFSALFTLYHCINEYTSETLTRGYTFILMKDFFDLKEKYFNYTGCFFLAWGHANYFYKLYIKERSYVPQDLKSGPINAVTYPSRSTLFWALKTPLILSGNILGVGVYFWEWFKITGTLNEAEENNQNFKLICLLIMTISVINEVFNARQVYYSRTSTHCCHTGASLLVNFISKAPALITIIYTALNNDQLLTPYAWDQATHLLGALNWITMSLRFNQGNYAQHSKAIYASMNKALKKPLNLLLFIYDAISRLLLETIGKGLPLIIFNDYIDCPYNILRIMGYILSLIATIVFIKEDILCESTEARDLSSELLLQRH